MGLKETLKRSFAKKDILMIPNQLSIFRLLLIPSILWLYNKKHQYGLAAAVVLLSGITDLLDGWIARKFHMVSDLGKFLDPLADKLTQGAMMLCLTERYPWIIWLFVFFVVKELCQLMCVSVSIHHSGKINSSNWFGKISTTMMYIVMVVLFLFPWIPDDIAMLLCGACGILLLVALTAYGRIEAKKK